MTHWGMTLRDYFAAMPLPVDQEGDWLGFVSYRTLREAFGDPPEGADGLLMWLAGVEAKIRYLRADAMLAERGRVAQD